MEVSVRPITVTEELLASLASQVGSLPMVSPLFTSTGRAWRQSSVSFG
jgi:hypothetical protein